MRDFVVEYISGNNFIGREQEEVDSLADDFLSEWGTIAYDISEIPGDAKQRRRTFWSPEDAYKYVRDGGIPADYVYFLKLPDWDDFGNTAIRVFILED
jgi:hypothetical protein